MSKVEDELPENPEDARPDDADLEALETDCLPRRPTTMRHPMILLLVIAGAAFLFVKTWPRAAYLFEVNNPHDCGNISDRPEQKLSDSGALPTLPHNRFCALSGTVESLAVLATGEEKDVPDPKARQAGRKYFAKLAGDKVFIILPADRDDVVQYRLKHENLLLGFPVEEVGRMIDPDQEAAFAQTARTLRGKFGLSDQTELRLFDTTDQPAGRWPYVAILALMVFTAGLALFGLVRLGIRRLKRSA